MADDEEQLPPNTKRTREGKVVSSDNEAPVPPRPGQELSVEEKVARLWAFTGPLAADYQGVDRSAPLGRAIYDRPHFGEVRDIVYQELRVEATRRTLRARVGNLLRTLADRLEFGRVHRDPFADLDTALGRKVTDDEIEHEPLRTGVFG